MATEYTGNLEPGELEQRWHDLERPKEEYPFRSDRIVGAREAELAGGWVLFEIYEMVEGRRVIAEVRVFPAWPDGRRSETMHGERAPDDVVPRGGVGARLMQRARLGHRHAEDVIVDYEEAIRERYGDKAAERFDATIKAKPRRSGGPALPDLYYADVAVQYEMVGKTGSRSPVKDLSEARGVTDSKIRSDIHRARGKGFLEPATMMGSPGGNATEKAHSLVQEERHIT